MVFLLLILLLWGYIAKCPPFFSDPIYVSPNASSPVGTCKDPLVKVKERTLYLKDPPMKYAYELLNRGKNGSMLEILVITIAGTIAGDNGGMNGKSYISQGKSSNRDIWNKDLNFGAAGVDAPLPNPLKLYKLQGTSGYAKIPKNYTGSTAGDSSSCVPGGFSCGPNYDCGSSNEFTDCNKDRVTLDAADDGDYDSMLAIPNVEGWYKYIYHTGELDKVRAAHARFMLCRFLELPTDVYIDDTDEVAYKDPNDKEVYGLARDHVGQALKIRRFKDWDYVSAMPKNMEIVGDFAICNTRLFQVQSGFAKWGMWVILIIIIVPILGFIVNAAVKFVRASKSENNNKGGPTVDAPSINNAGPPQAVQTQQTYYAEPAVRSQTTTYTEPPPPPVQTQAN